MSRAGSRRRSKGGNRAYVVMAAAMVCMLAVGTVAGVIADRKGSPGDGGIDQGGVTSATPAAEVSQLQTRVAANPGDLDATMLLAEVLANGGRSDKAIALLSAAVAGNPEFEALRVSFGRTLIRTGDYFDAEIQLRKAVELDASDQAAAFYLATALESRGDEHVGEASVWYQRAIDIDPETLIAEQAREALARLQPGPTPTPIG